MVVAHAPPAAALSEKRKTSTTQRWSEGAARDGGPGTDRRERCMSMFGKLHSTQTTTASPCSRPRNEKHIFWLRHRNVNERREGRRSQRALPAAAVRENVPSLIKFISGLTIRKSPLA
ncbi:hypothetical protein EVAR_91249_1 [Eumeta japonica]|uniref:Uncharacterized protein n=1 Tax=Eumeta variegata TaxID=151549 RepID=A0A4C1ZWT4_EUMVA|nr:hypothetical protein EVAR_91249_1 [Eumeta japonica]